MVSISSNAFYCKKHDKSGQGDAGWQMRHKARKKGGLRPRILKIIGIGPDLF
jgi:hypothetical protein